MRNLISTLFVLATLAAPPCVGAIENEEEIIRQITQLDWVYGPGEVKIGPINARYELGGDQMMVKGEDAKRYMELSEGTTQFNKVNFVTIRGAGTPNVTQTVYAHASIGYIEDDDWQEVEDSEILAALKANTEKANEERRANGYPTVSVDGWRVRPQYDPDKNLMYWVTNASGSTGERVINATVVKLSRDGFTHITWVGQPETFTPGLLTANIGDPLQFDQGYRYADFSAGDAVVGVGIASLATGLAKGKGWGKGAAAGLFAVLIAFAKKLWFLLLAPFIWIGSKLFGKRDETSGV